MRIFNPASAFYTYPGISIVCGNEEYLDDEFNALLNPVIIVEVLSKSTEEYDRGTRFTLYRSISVLQHYLPVSSTGISVDLFTKNNSGWLLTTAGRLTDRIRLSAIGYELLLEGVYAQSGLQNYARQIDGTFSFSYPSCNFLTHC